MIKILVRTVEYMQSLEQHQAIQQNFSFSHLSAPVLVWGFHFETFSFVFVLLWILFLIVFNNFFSLRIAKDSKFIS